MILLSFFICISIPLGATLPTGDPSQFTGSECRVYDEDNKCPPGHELIECGDKYAGLMRCSPCKENMYQCDFTTPEFSVTCQPPTCPDLGTETTYNVTYFENKTCHIYCLCNERNGYTGISGSRCTKHPPCGLNKEFKNGTCVDCRPGFHNPNTDYGPCVAYETMTLLASSPITESTPGGSSVPTDQGSRESNKYWIFGLIVPLIGILIILACGCWRDAEAPENPPPYTPNDSLSSGTGSHQPNGIPPAPRNGIPGTGSNGIRGARTNGTNGIPGGRTNGIPGARTNGIPGGRTNGIPDVPGNQVPHVSGSHSSISERPTPTGTGHPSTESLASSPGPLTSQGDVNNFLLSEPLTSEGATLNLQTPELTSTDPEQTGRKMPIPAQDIVVGSGDMNDETGDDEEGEDDDDENQELLGGAECGLVELDKDRDLSHVPLVQ